VFVKIPEIGKHFSFLAEKQNLSRALAFIVLLQSEMKVMDYKINVETLSGIETYSFYGFHNVDLHIIAIKDKSLSGKFMTCLKQIDGNLYDEFEPILRTPPFSDELFYYDEISRINNELVNSQRREIIANAELKRLNKEKNQFIGILVHDLRNPLSIISMHSSMLLDSNYGVIDKFHKELVSNIREMSLFMNNLINDTLEVTSIESGDVNLLKLNYDLCQILASIVSLISLIAKSKEITVNLEKPGIPCMINLDKNKIEQVIYNIIGNAIKYSPRGSMINVFLEIIDGNTVISVHNNGETIPENEKENIFKPFNKTSIKGTEGERSTGLGLYISKKIIEGHDGKIWFESNNEKGTTFYFSLPKGRT
jgi:signal transduction histidine kinase